MPIQSVSLSQLLFGIKAEISSLYPNGIWVVGEISDLKQNQTGHCYLELIEKENTTDKVLARCRATIWATNFRVLKPYFESVTGVKFTSGLKILLNVYPEFHESFGFTLNIRDIDPAYTLGEMVLRRNETIERLTSDGIFDLNKSLCLPAIPKRIAVISSLTAAGYEDFVHQIENNTHNFAINLTLFPAAMQGEQTASSIMAALDLIFEYEASFDLVAIIRGGGAKTDLIAFDDYELASYIAQFPLPIITGIGHERDESIADLVAHTSLKTPTAVAEFMLTLMLQKLNEYTNAAENLKTTINQYFEVRNQKLAQIHVRFKPVVLRQIDQNQFKISTLANRLRISSQNHFEAKKQTIHRLATTVQTRAQLQISVQTHHISLLSSKLQHNSQANISQKCTNVAALERALVHLNPYNILGRGFTATFIDGKLIASVKDLKKGRVIVTRFVDGELTSQIISARENNTED